MEGFFHHTQGSFAIESINGKRVVDSYGSDLAFLCCGYELTVSSSCCTGTNCRIQMDSISMTEASGITVFDTSASKIYYSYHRNAVCY